MFETETAGPCLVRKLNWGGMAPLIPTSEPLKSTEARLEPTRKILEYGTKHIQK